MMLHEVMQDEALQAALHVHPLLGHWRIGRNESAVWGANTTKLRDKKWETDCYDKLIQLRWIGYPEGL